MPKYRITSPDGKTYEITAPDGASQDEVMAYAQKQHAQPFVNSVGRIPKPNPNAEGANPTEGASFGENFWAGAGKSLVDTAQGVSQIFGGSDAIDSRFGGGVDDRRKQDASLMGTGGGFVGNVAGQAAQMSVPVAGGARLAALAGRAAPYVGAALRGGAFAASQGVGEGETRAGNAAMGATLGGAGQGIASGLGKLAVAAKPAANSVVQRSIDAARAAGIPLHVSQVTNSKVVKTMGSVLNQLPFTGAGKAAQKQQEAFNRAVSRSFGADAGTLSDDVMHAAKTNLGGQYDRLFNGRTIGLDRQAVNDLFSLHRAVGDDLEASQAAVARKQIERILDESGNLGAMPGKVYQDLRSQLRKKFGKDDSLGRVVMDARKILDDSASRSLGPAEAQTLKKLNGQYANFQTARDALKQVAGSAGDIKPAALWPLIRKGSTAPMRELAKIGQNVLKDPIPDSGTAGRLLLAGGGMTAGGMGGVAGIAALAKPVAVGALAGRTMNSNAASKMLEQGNVIGGLARLSKAAPKGLPALGNAMGGGSRFAQIFAAAGADPSKGPEIIANLAPQEQQAAIMQFAQQNKLDPQEVARRVQAESARLQELR